MDPDDDDVFLTPAARLCELAEILAAGILRLHVCEALVGDSEEGPPTKRRVRVGVTTDASKRIGVVNASGPTAAPEHGIARLHVETQLAVAVSTLLIQDRGVKLSRRHRGSRPYLEANPAGSLARPLKVN